jgi:hypothetical protein
MTTLLPGLYLVSIERLRTAATQASTTAATAAAAAATAARPVDPSPLAASPSPSPSTEQVDIVDPGDDPLEVGLCR